MIISHKHKFIFIKTKKTAGTSIEIALSSICGDEDVLSIIEDEDQVIRQKVANRASQNNKIPFRKYSYIDWLKFFKYRKRRLYFSHMSASLIKNHVDSKIWDSYYKFCFDRHPIDKTISHFNWQLKKGGYDDFSIYLHSDKILRLKGYSFYKDVAGNYLVDKVYKMEEMDDAFADIAEKIGVSPSSLRPPDFITKKSHKYLDLSREQVVEEYGEKLQSIFKTEFQDLYNAL